MDITANKLILYNDKEIYYITGDVYEWCVEPHYLEYDDGSGFKQYFETSKTYRVTTTYSVTTNNPVNEETIKLDETLMKRIAKYNKEVEIKKLDETIKQKKEKIKELDDILQDKDKRVQKIKQFVANIYNLDISDEDDEDEDYDY